MALKRKNFINGPTPLQINLIRILTEYLTNPPKDPSQRKSMKQLCLEAGYSQAMSKNASKAIRSDAVVEALEPILNRIEAKRNSALSHLTEAKMVDSSARDLTYIFSELTKNHQLLSGAPTANVNNLYDDEQIKAIAARIVAGDGSNPSTEKTD